MKITLKRKLKLKSAILYLKLKAEVQREDIKNYLDSGSFSNPIIEKRVRNYLKGLGIYDNEFKLTREGIRAKETGLVKEDEEGKYQIWYLQNDSVFGNRIFHFKRVEPVMFDRMLKPLGIESDDKTFHSFPIFGEFGKESVDFLIVGSLKEAQGEDGIDTVIDCTWVWHGIDKSLFNFYGELKIFDKDGKIKTDSIDGAKAVDFNVDLKPHIENVIPNWNENTGRCRLKMENLENDDNYRYFEYSGNRPRDGYNYCFYDKMPIEPYNLDEAREWRDKILNMDLEKQYVHPGDFSDHVSVVNSRVGFKAFDGELDIPDTEQYIKKLDSGKKSSLSTAYWHLTAPLDLNVRIPQQLQLASFSLKQGEKINFEDIVQNFGTIKADKIFYYDRYVINYYQQRAVYAFLKCFNVSDVRVITDKNPDQQDFNDYLSRQGQCSVEDIGVLYHDKKDIPHDRFIVFRHKKELLVWTVTNSIGYIRFDVKGDISPQTEGKVLKSVTYTKIKPMLLEQQLAKFILER